jgi:hypothetical protein
MFWLFSLEIQGSWSGSSHCHSSVGKAVAAQAKSGDWEIDRRLLKIGERIASGSCGDLWVGLFKFATFLQLHFWLSSIIVLICQLLLIWRYRGVYFGEDVAIKILRSEQLNGTQEEEFAQEVTILRWIVWNEVHVLHL